MRKKQKECVHEICRNGEPLEECPYCGYCYCNAHITAKAPGKPLFKVGGDEQILMSEWHEGGGHPCPEYVRYLIDETRRAKLAQEMAVARERTESKKSEFYHSILAVLASIVNVLSVPIGWFSRNMGVLMYNITVGSQYFIAASLAFFKMAFAVLLLLTALWASNSLMTEGRLPSLGELAAAANQTAPAGNCTATWLSGECDPDSKPLYCNNGTVENRSGICGCGGELRPYEDYCIPKVMCIDGTLAPDCSPNRPYQCVNGTLVQRASVCGCPSQSSFRKVGDVCIEISKTEAYIIESKIHELINAERMANGLEPLRIDANLTAISRAHSQDMLNNEYLEHKNLAGEDATQRASRAGYQCRKGTVIDTIGENIGLAYTYDTIYYVNGIETKRDRYSVDDVAEMVVAGWMNSEGHRRNILTDSFEYEGVGVAISIEGRILITQDFC